MPPGRTYDAHDAHDDDDDVITMVTGFSGIRVEQVVPPSPTQALLERTWPLTDAAAGLWTI